MTSLRRVRSIQALAIFAALLCAGLAAVTAAHPRGARPEPHAPGSPAAAPVVRPHPDTIALEHKLYDARVHWYTAIALNAERERSHVAMQLIAATQQRRAVWERLAHCESAGNWSVVDRYGGGLGIYIGTWHAFNGDQFASNPGYATEDQQIVVAERIYARFGFSGWGCAHTLGWVH